MSFNYYFNDPSDWFSINRNADLYAQNGALPNLNEFDYILDISGVLNDMFNTKTYQQNSEDANLYNVSLVVNADYVVNMTANTNMVNSASNLATGIVGSNTTVGTRVLEILALKIFGHARARAAIANDSDIVAGIASDLANHVQNVVSAHRNDIFNQYVQQDLAELSANDVNEPVSFNFQNDTLIFPGYVSGSLVNKAGLSAQLLNGPADMSGHMVANGDYNVPILLRLCA